MSNIVTNKNGVEFDIDAIATDLNGKMDRDGNNATASVCISSWHNDDGDYCRIYSDGWCEQGGKIPANGAVYTITFHQPFMDTNYSAFKNEGENSSNSSSHYTVSCYNFTTTTMQTFALGNGVYGRWRAEGYIR